MRRTLKTVVPGEELLVIIHPRTPAVGEHYVRTLASQTPNPERTKAALRAAPPAGEVENYEAITAVTWGDIEVVEQMDELVGPRSEILALDRTD